MYAGHCGRHSPRCRITSGLIGPLSAIVCFLEIYLRWLIGLLLPNSPLGLLPGRPSFFNSGSLLRSSLATYGLIPLLYVFLETHVMPAEL